MKIKAIKKIPTLIGLSVIVIGLAVSIFLVEKSQNIFLRAKTTNSPAQIKITNITDTSFTVSWFTANPSIGLLKFGTQVTMLDREAGDERNAEVGQNKAYFSHYVNVSGLEPATAYYYEIYVDSDKFNDNGNPFQIATAPKIGASRPNDLAYGIILESSGLPAEGAIIYLNMANSSSQSSLVTSSGNWAVPLNLIRSSDLSHYLAYDPEASIIEIFVQHRDQTATAITTTSNDSPTPPITIGESFDFRKKESSQPEIGANETPEATVSSGFNLEEPVASPAFSLSIFNPQPGEEITSSKPEFLGKGPSGKEIDIKVESPVYTDHLTPSNQGDWNWTPPADLEPGNHTISISYIDEQGKEHLISHTFVVLAADQSQLPSFTATPSATPTSRVTPKPTATTTLKASPTPLPSATPKLSPTPSPKASPTISITPTVTPKVSPTISPTATPTAKPTITPTRTPTPKLSPTPAATTPGAPGVFAPTLIVSLIGILAVGLGFLLSFL